MPVILQKLLSMPKKIILCTNLDEVKKKNAIVFKLLSKRYIIKCFCYAKSRQCSSLKKYFTEKIYPKNKIKRIVFFFQYLHKIRHRLSHIEIYTGEGAFLLAEFLIAKILKIKIITVERGSFDEVLTYYKNFRKLITIVIYFLIYYFSDLVWIRELWVKKYLRFIPHKKILFLANAALVPSPKKKISFKRKYKFIWYNSFKPMRYPCWVAEALKDITPKVRYLFVGKIPKNKITNPVEKKVKSILPNLKILPFNTNNKILYSADFFVLAAKIVFLNNSLLEAMARGCIPIVNSAPGVHKIIQDGKDGLIAKSSKIGFRSAMIRAANMNQDQINTLRNNCINKVQTEYSLISLVEKLHIAYNRL